MVQIERKNTLHTNIKYKHDIKKKKAKIFFLRVTFGHIALSNTKTINRQEIGSYIFFANLLVCNLLWYIKTRDTYSNRKYRKNESN